jgi:hypothetical protein
LRGSSRIDQPLCHGGDELVDPRMFGEPAFIEVPQLAEPPVPEIEPAVRGKYADHLEQIVEGGGADPEQRVAGRGQPHLLGPVLED